jgi:hypothetical protein
MPNVGGLKHGGRNERMSQHVKIKMQALSYLCSSDLLRFAVTPLSITEINFI